MSYSHRPTADAPALPPIAALKKEAKNMKHQWNGEFSLSECYSIVARDHGFKNWNDLTAKHPELNDRQKWFEQQSARREDVVIERKLS
jgi:hypothetical protein